MKNLLLTFLAIAVIFSACEKEEEPTTTTTTTTTTITSYVFSCKVGGVIFTDNTPIVDTSLNVLTIDSENGGNTIRIIIYNFSDRNVGEEISLNYGNNISGAYVTNDRVDYTRTQSGKLIFTKMDAKLSGTFNFTSESSDFSSKSVTEGVFVDLTY